MLTHPEAWGDAELLALREAARRAGIDPGTVLFVSEPRAAATYYTAATHSGTGGRIGVFDFGGGTLDVAILEGTADGDFRVLAARGDNGIGGRNVDALLRAWVLDELDDSDPALAEHLRSRGATPAEMRALDAAVRAAKELLSESSSASITVAAAERRETLLVARPEFEARIRPEVERALALTQAAMRDAGVEGGGAHGGAGLRALYLTGGSSRVPLVHAGLAEIAPVATLDDPKTVVAQGALLGALRLERRVGVGVGTGAGSAAPPRPTPSRTRSRRHVARLLGAGVLALVLVAGGTAAALGWGPFPGPGGGSDSPVEPDAAGDPLALLPEATRAGTTCEPESQRIDGGPEVDGSSCTFDVSNLGIGDRYSFSFPVAADPAAATAFDEKRAGEVGAEGARATVDRVDSSSGEWHGYIEVGDGYTSLTAIDTTVGTVIESFYTGTEDVARQLWDKGGFAGA